MDILVINRSCLFVRKYKINVRKIRDAIVTISQTYKSSLCKVLVSYIYEVLRVFQAENRLAFKFFIKKKQNQLIIVSRTGRKTSNELSRFSHKCDYSSVREMAFRGNVIVSKLFSSNKTFFFSWHAVKIGTKWRQYKRYCFRRRSEGLSREFCTYLYFNINFKNFPSPIIFFLNLNETLNTKGNVLCCSI